MNIKIYHQISETERDVYEFFIKNNFQGKLGYTYCSYHKSHKDSLHPWGDQRDRQLKLIGLFEQGKYDEMFDFYDTLPRCENKECPEQEYVGYWFHVLFCGANPYHLYGVKKGFVFNADMGELIIDGERVKIFGNPFDNQ